MITSLNKTVFTAMLAGLAQTCLSPAVASADVFNMGDGLTSLEFVTIDHAGNAFDDDGFDLGAVSYDFRMGTYEVTNAQYAEFLNHAAASDPHSLYSPAMSSEIVRSGVGGAYSYQAVAGRGNNPVRHVSFFDAMRFVNWLENGQGMGETESGVYVISDGASETRASNASYFLPNADEWHKAAFYQPASQGGDADDWWFWATGSNTLPVPGVDANFSSAIGDTTPVGSFDSTFFGAHDLAGNVEEWTENAPIFDDRGVFGGAWDLGEGFFRANTASAFPAGTESDSRGFRIAATIPACYADCDESGELDFFDFLCFQNEFAAGAAYADCDESGELDFFDFLCFQNEFAAGCP